MSNKLTQAVLPLILLFSSGVWTAEETLDITLPAWSTDSVYGDNTVYEINLTQTALTSTSETGVNTNKLGGVYFEPFAKIPSPGDKRCHDNDCNYYLDISDIWIQSIQRGGRTLLIMVCGGMGDIKVRARVEKVF